MRLALVALLSTCMSGCGAQKAQDEPLKTIWDHFTVQVAGHPASVQLAVLDAEKERGLMQRPDLGKDEGMIFVYRAPERQNYWMRNTPEPLEIAYANPEGVIMEVYPMIPLDERGVTSRSSEIQYVLEMPQGWFRANAVRIGDRIDKKALGDAVKARGFDPAAYGLR
jgi:hypothetical protein